MMSHSPLRMFKRYHDKCVLVSGQGPLLDIAQEYLYKPNHKTNPTTFYLSILLNQGQGILWIK